MIKGFKKIILWYYLLSKRLFKKAGFLIILAVIPVLTLAFSVMAESSDSGLFRIATCLKDPNDKAALEVLKDIEQGSDVISFIRTDNEAQLINMVESGKADAGWVFEENFKLKLTKYSKDKLTKLITVYEAEYSSINSLSREKIYAALYPKISYDIYVKYTYELLPEHKYTEKELRDLYLVFAEDEELFEFKFLDSIQPDIETANYLTAPLRGLLTAVMLLCGMAAAMYYLKDEERGTFSWLATKRRYFALFGSVLSALIISGVFVTLALILSGLYTNPLTETVTMLLFILASTGFCSLLASVFKKISFFSILIPIVLVSVIAFCPVFFNINFLPVVSLILPPRYYLYSINNFNLSLQLMVYSVVSILLGYAVFTLMRKKDG